jgi:hypothetical protein
MKTTHKMKRIAKGITLAVFMAFTIVGFAQQREISPEQKEAIKAQREADLATLNMSDTQRKQFDEISERYMKQFKEIHRGSLAQEEKRAEAKRLTEAQNKEMKAVLNNDQYNKYLELQKKRRKQMMRKRRAY